MLLLPEIKKLHNLKIGDRIIHTYSGQKFEVNDIGIGYFTISAIEENSNGLAKYNTSGTILRYAFIVNAIINNEYGPNTRYIFKNPVKKALIDYIRTDLNVHH